MKVEDIQDHKIMKNTIGQETFSGIQFCSTDVNDKSNVKSNDKSNDRSNNQTKTDKISLHTVVKHKLKSERNRIVTDKKNHQVSNRYQNKLLQRLLSRSIQHERNLICQCLKYIIDNNFFNPSLS